MWLALSEVEVGKENFYSYSLFNAIYMTRNIWIGVVVVAVLAAGGWQYLNMSSVPATSDTAQLPTTQQNTTGGTQQIASVKVGDKIGAFTVASIKPSTMRYANPQKDFTVSFSGQTTIKGTAEIGGFWGTDSVTLAIEKADNPQLPRFMFVENENTKLIVCISNPDAARQALSGKQGNVSVMVKNYVVRFETDTAFCDGAEFIGLAQ